MRDRFQSELGQGVIALVAVVVVVAGAVGLLVRTHNLANEINDTTESIAHSGTGINASTKAIIELNQTNELGDSILATAKPLEEKLAEIVRLAQSIDRTASGITDSALTINGTANGINGTAAQILGIAESINRGVETINRNVDVTIGLVRQIQGDTSNILKQAHDAHRNAACIDQGLPGGRGDGHCKAG